MGEVYLAVDSVLERPVAVKLLSAHYAGDPESRARFRREALSAARLSRERHVVTVFDVGEHFGRPLIVMEYVDGGSVHDRLVEGAVTREGALAWLEQVAHALDRAHAHGIVHRDVKPANLLIDSEGHVRVTDFGIASTSGLETVTLPGTVLGTAGYISPEQARGEPASPASDRYSLAVIAFELLTGRRPFEGETAATQALAHVTAPVPSAERIDPGLPEGVDDVLARGLAKDPADRPSSCAELVSELRVALERAGGTVAERDGVGETAIVPVARAASTRVLPRPSSPPAVPARDRSRPARRSGARRRHRPRTAVVVAVLAILLGGIAGFALVGLGDDPAQPAAGGRAPAGSSGAPADDGSPPVDGAALNAEGFELMQAGRFEEAQPVLRRAVGALLGTKTLDEAFASYNLAFTRFALGACTGVVGLLDRSERIQGERDEIDALRDEWDARCALGDETERAERDDDDDRPGNGRGRGRGNGPGRGDD